MKLFHKIFLCFVIIFGVTFSAAGFLLINYAYHNSIEQEKKFAFQEFQYNKYILQSILYSDPEYITSSETENSALNNNFTVPVTLYDKEGKCIFSSMSALPDIDTSYSPDSGSIFFKIEQNGDKYSIFVHDVISSDEHEIYLVTETDISQVVDKQEMMHNYFQRIYMIILCVVFPAIFLLTGMITAPIKNVSKAAKRIAGGNYSERISFSGHDEICELADNFNQMAERVEEKIDELSGIAKQKEEFAANFAHELKTPMTSVIGYADMLYQKDLSREQVKSAAYYIWNEGMRLEALSLKLMDLFVLDKQDFKLEKMDVKELFRNISEGIYPVCKKNGVIFHMGLENGKIYVDFDLLKTMILNMVDNAVKADCSDIWIVGKAGREGYVIQIADNGKGIPKNELGRITEAFYMVDKSRSRKQHGAGIGMALVAKIAAIHHAKMKIESDGKSGTVLSFTFPFKGGPDND
ncbi:MAG: sensor histidine kinase [Lachnospiraceae bacterium]|jgi:integral membrane sensor signal transduction histidine kinase